MFNLFEAVRQNVGEAPRSIPLAQRQHYLPATPPWASGHVLGRVARDRKILWKTGRVVAGAIVQANSALYQPGLHDLPALAIWGEASNWETEPQKLRELAREIAQLSDEKAAAEKTGDGWKDVIRIVKDLHAFPLHHRLPEDFAEGAPFFLTSLLVWRSQLPFGFLTGGIVPLLVAPPKTPVAWIVPARFWPDALKDR